MNERMKELAKQAEEYAVSVCDQRTGVYQGKEYLEVVQEKFAELIVQECIQLAKQQHALSLKNDWDGNKTAYAIRDSIEQHFYKDGQ